MDENSRIKNEGFPILQKNLKGLLNHLKKWIITTKLKPQKL
jgi:hypothetical protein